MGRGSNWIFFGGYALPPPFMPRLLGMSQQKQEGEGGDSDHLLSARGGLKATVIETLGVDQRRAGFSAQLGNGGIIGNGGLFATLDL